MTNQYLFGPEKAHRRAADGRFAVESTLRHQTEMEALGQAIDPEIHRQQARYSKLGRGVVLALRHFRSVVDNFLEQHVIQSRFGKLTGLKEDDSWRDTFPPQDPIKADESGSPITRQPLEPGEFLNDEVHEPASNGDGLE